MDPGAWWAMVHRVAKRQARLSRHTLLITPGSPLVKTPISLQETWVPSLVMELRSHVLYGAARRKIKMKTQAFKKGRL